MTLNDKQVKEWEGLENTKRGTFWYNVEIICA